MSRITIQIEIGECGVTADADLFSKKNVSLSEMDHYSSSFIVNVISIWVTVVIGHAKTKSNETFPTTPEIVPLNSIGLKFRS